MALQQTLEIQFEEPDFMVNDIQNLHKICVFAKKDISLWSKNKEKQKIMLQTILSNTARFIESAPKADRKRYGQFFTAEKSAVHMASMFDFDLNKPSMNILDAGAGTGLLSAAVVARLVDLGYMGHVHLVCYETDVNVLPILCANMEYLRTHADFSYIINTENYLLSQSFECENAATAERFDYIIGNPPYLKISKDAPEAKAMKQICYGAPNLYFLFWAMGVFNLKTGGELVYIVPRSWTSGAYFEYFRKYLFSHCVIEQMHLFVSRDKVFDKESVLQETMIIKVRKTLHKPPKVIVTSSSTAEYLDMHTFLVPYSTIVAQNQFVYIVTNQQEVNVLKRIHKLPQTLSTIDLKMKTGIIVDFRTQEVLRDKMEEGAYPLFYASHIKDGRIIWPIGRTGEYISTEHKGYLQPNQNYLFVKRFTSKEEPRRLQCGMYRAKDYPQYSYISTQNKINYIACSSLCVLYGLFALLGSTLYDQYYRILNGSTQVNSTEVNAIPMPDRTTIENIGRELMKMPITESSCNKIVDKWIS
ncbi:MAG: Eco57I restriction-modification methylase domain-containing protein [Paludibacteraceae bacterium]|nr:Eco57I restriction-modification methylase domain-containing protein [Paludibacteraceae bacterium]